MRQRRTVCIDLGSAFTKVAVRSDWNAGAELLADLPRIADADVSFCVPSVVARIEGGASPRWEIGQAAANQVPGPRVNVFTNWKAELMSPSTGPARLAEVHDAGVAFLRELRLALDKRQSVHAVRVCVPRLPNDEDVRGRVTTMARDAGWSSCERATVYEPESNAIGLFTRGTNATHVPVGGNPRDRSGTRYPHYRRMFSSVGLLASIRNGNTHRALVVDVGAFTTDFALVTFPAEPGSRATIVQTSVALGVSELDCAVIDAQPAEAGEALRAMSVRARNAVLRLLYRGGAAQVLGRASGRLTIGGDAGSRGVIAGLLDQFAARVAQATADFTSKHAAGSFLNTRVLTGGGSMIGEVRRRTLALWSDRFGGIVHDLLDPNEPERSLLCKFDARRRPYYEPGAIEARRVENQSLVRAGSAIGGCSVYFE